MRLLVVICVAPFALAAVILSIRDNLSPKTAAVRQLDADDIGKVFVRVDDVATSGEYLYFSSMEGSPKSLAGSHEPRFGIDLVDYSEIFGEPGELSRLIDQVESH